MLASPWCTASHTHISSMSLYQQMNKVDVQLQVPKSTHSIWNIHQAWWFAFITHLLRKPISVSKEYCQACLIGRIQIVAPTAGSFGKGVSLVVRRYVAGNRCVMSVNVASKAGFLGGETGIESKVPGVGGYIGKVSLTWYLFQMNGVEDKNFVPLTIWMPKDERWSTSRSNK